MYENSPVAKNRPGYSVLPLTKNQWRRIRQRIGPWAPLIVLILMCIIIGQINPRFLTMRNVTRLANSASIPLILALGGTFVILLGSIDLSLEGVMALCAVLVSLTVLNDRTDFAWGYFGVVVAVGAGALMGLVNGLIHVKLRIPSFMATLGMSFVGIGIATVLIGGIAVRVLDQNIRALALERFLDFPYGVWVALGTLVVTYHPALHETRTVCLRDRRRRGPGGAVGHPGGPLQDHDLHLAGALYGLAGLLAAAQLGQGNAVISQGGCSPRSRAIVVGGTALSGGIGSVMNTLVSVLIVAVLDNGMVLMGVSPYIQQAVLGLLILVAVGISLNRSQIRSSSERRTPQGPDRHDHDTPGQNARAGSQRVNKSFPGVQALKDVSIAVYPNEVVGLVGENGAGKSTLMRILAGIYAPDSGQIILDGKPVTLNSARQAADHGIGMVYQEQSLLLNLSVAENIYLGHESEFMQFGLIRWDKLLKAARRQLEKGGGGRHRPAPRPPN